MPGSSLLCGLPLVAVSRGYSLLVVRGILSLQNTGSKGLWAQQLLRTGLAAPRHVVGASQIRDRTRVSCIAKWVLHH